MQMRSCWRHFGERGASITPRARAAESETPRESVAGALVPDAEPHGRSDGDAGKTVLRFLSRAFQTGARPKSVRTSEDQHGAGFNEHTAELPRPSRTSRLPIRGHQSSGRKGAPRGSWPIAKVIYDGNTSCLLLKAFSVMISSPLHINNHFQYHQNDTNPKAIAITFCERSNCI